MPIPSSSPWVTAARTRPATGRRVVPLHGLLAMLLVLAVAALVVVADRLIDTWTDGHLFLAWVGLWLVVFATTVLLDSWARCRASARSDAQRHSPEPVPTDTDLQTNTAARRRADWDSSQHGSFLPYP